GLATVSRTLELLTELNGIDRVNFGSGVARCDLRKEGATHFHHHLICTTCGPVEAIEQDLRTALENIIAKDCSFLVVDHRLPVHGICRKCQEKDGGTNA